VRAIRLRDRPAAPVDTRHFTGAATMQPALAADEGEPVRLYRVRFDEGGRTNWHRHDDVQVLYGLDGTCIVVNRAGEELLLGPGDVVVVEAGEEHWHGAAPGGPGEHLAVNVGTRTTWLEPVG